MKAGKENIVVPGMENDLASSSPALTFDYFHTAAATLAFGFNPYVLPPQAPPSPVTCSMWVTEPW